MFIRSVYLPEKTPGTTVEPYTSNHSSVYLHTHQVHRLPVVCEQGVM